MTQFLKLKCHLIKKKKEKKRGEGSILANLIPYNKFKDKLFKVAKQKQENIKKYYVHYVLDRGAKKPCQCKIKYF